MTAWNIKTWPEAKAVYELDPAFSITDAAKAMKVTRQAASARAKREKWKKAEPGAIDEQTHAHRLAALASLPNPKREDEALVAARAGMQAYMAHSARMPENENLSAEEAEHRIAVDQAIAELVRMNWAKEGEVQQAQVMSRVLMIHRQDWIDMRASLRAALASNSYNALRVVQMASNVITAIQNGERKAYGLDDGDKAPKVLVINRGDSFRDSSQYERWANANGISDRTPNGYKPLHLRDKAATVDAEVVEPVASDLPRPQGVRRAQ